MEERSTSIKVNAIKAALNALYPDSVPLEMCVITKSTLLGTASGVLAFMSRPNQTGLWLATGDPSDIVPSTPKMFWQSTPGQKPEPTRQL